MTIKHMWSFDSYGVRVKESQRRYRMIVDEVLFANEPDRIKLRNANLTAREKRHRIEIVYGTQCAQWILEETRYFAPRDRVADWVTDTVLAPKHLGGGYGGHVDLGPLATHVPDLDIASQPWMVPRPFTMEHPRGVPFEPRPYQKDAMKMFEKGIDEDLKQMLYSDGRRLPRYFFSTPQVSLQDLADFDHPFEKKVVQMADTHYELTARNVGKTQAVMRLPFMTTQLLAQWLRNNSVGK